MIDPLIDVPNLADPHDWDPPPPTTAALADQLLIEHAALTAANEALAAARAHLAFVLTRERALRSTLANRMTKDGIERIDRPRGSIVEISARIRSDEGGGLTVIALASLRVLPRQAIEDPLFVLRQAEETPHASHSPNDEQAPASERRRTA